jgi:hypothetical protein
VILAADDQLARERGRRIDDAMEVGGQAVKLVARGTDEHREPADALELRQLGDLQPELRQAADGHAVAQEAHVDVLLAAPAAEAGEAVAVVDHCIAIEQACTIIEQSAPLRQLGAVIAHCQPAETPGDGADEQDARY